MKPSSVFINEDIAAKVATSMTNEKVLSSTRLTTGDQFFVFAIKTNNSEYVIRMTTPEHKEKFSSALYWQEKLIPFGVSLAKFIKYDLDGEYSQFPALLMMRLPGDDLCNVYSQLTDAEKRFLAEQMVKIQNATNELPDGNGYGIASSYSQIPEDSSWYDFLVNRLHLFLDIIKENKVFDINYIKEMLAVAKSMEEDLRQIQPRPFLWDASERNVLVSDGKISGIVDVDDIAFGDPLFVLALTYVALESDGHDTLYVDYWAEALQLDKKAQLRLAFYRLFYCIVFMRKHTMISANHKKIIFDVQRLESIFEQSRMRIKEFGI